MVCVVDESLFDGLALDARARNEEAPRVLIEGRENKFIRIGFVQVDNRPDGRNRGSVCLLCRRCCIEVVDVSQDVFHCGLFDPEFAKVIVETLFVEVSLFIWVSLFDICEFSSTEFWIDKRA